MCQAPVGKVIRAENGLLLVKYKGKTIALKSKIPDVTVGDYVMFALDIAIDKVDKEEAEAVLGMVK
jgi:hydrogenase maturation factor